MGERAQVCDKQKAVFALNLDFKTLIAKTLV